MGWKSHRKPLKSLKTDCAGGKASSNAEGWGSLGVKKVAENDA
jgi:hypothetical protein